MNLPVITDEQLIVNARDKSEESEDLSRLFCVLVERHHDALYQYLWRKTYNAHDAEDLAQETFVRAYERIDLFDPKYRFKTWLYTIATRLCINQHRKLKPVLNEEIIQDQEDVKEEGDNGASLWEEARHLSEDYYTVLLLKYTEELSVREIAKVMEKSESHVKVLLHRARKALGERIKTKTVES